MIEEMGYEYGEMLELIGGAEKRKIGVIPWSAVTGDGSSLQAQIEHPYYNLLSKSKRFLVIGWAPWLVSGIVKFYGSAISYAGIIGERGFKELIKSALRKLRLTVS